MLTNILDVTLQLFEVNGEITLNFLEQFIGVLIGAVGITGLGIILYCLILKVLVLPLDIWQKASMRKQSLKMEQMRGQLEKLQQQYANSPELYQKKIQEVYKQNNFNMLASCLPMIATLVVLIFAFSSLTGFSQHKNLSLYTDMAASYDVAIKDLCDPNAAQVNYNDELYRVEGENENYYVYYLQSKTDVNYKEYKINVARLQALKPELTDETACENYVRNIARNAAAKTYQEKKEGFFWIKNIYYPDVAWAQPLEDYNGFCNSINEKIMVNGKEVGVRDFINENVYNEITYNLSEEKGQPNGFFVLVVLTILTNLASQFIAMRSQKAQRELQTADKSSQGMQNMMMFVMPIMFCIFAFIYSGAFSLYLITSGLFSLLSTLIVNKLIDVAFKKKQAIEEKAQIQYGGRKALTRDWERNREIMGQTNKDDKNNGKKR